MNIALMPPDPVLLARLSRVTSSVDVLPPVVLLLETKNLTDLSIGQQPFRPRPQAAAAGPSGKIGARSSEFGCGTEFESLLALKI